MARYSATPTTAEFPDAYFFSIVYRHLLQIADRVRCMLDGIDDDVQIWFPRTRVFDSAYTSGSETPLLPTSNLTVANGTGQGSANIFRRLRPFVHRLCLLPAIACYRKCKPMKNRKLDVELEGAAAS